MATRLGTATAGLSTALAVLMVVFLALSRTEIARFRTHATQVSMKVRVTCHKPSAERTSVCTVSAGLNALRHHLYHVAV